MKTTDGNTSKGTIDNNDNSETTQNMTEDVLEKNYRNSTDRNHG